MLSNFTQQRAPHERDQHCQSAASAYDRKYGCVRRPAQSAERLVVAGVQKPAHHRKPVDLSIASSTFSNQQSIPTSKVFVYSTDRDTIWRLLWIDEREQT
jgi:hypothetical protein